MNRRTTLPVIDASLHSHATGLCSHFLGPNHIAVQLKADGGAWKRAKIRRDGALVPESPNEGSSDTSSFCLARLPVQELPSYAIPERSGRLSGGQCLLASGLD